MHTVHQPPDRTPDSDTPPPVPYFRAERFRRLVDQAAEWYAGGLPYEPWNAA